MDTKIFEQLGMTRSEAMVYVKLLELGATKTGQLTSEAQVSRSKIYEILNKLMQKGLASYVVRENIKYFEAADPTNLKEFLHAKRKALDRDETQLDEAMPALEALQAFSKEKQTATVFEGFKGLRTVFNDVLGTLKRGQEYCAFAIGKESYSREWSLFIMNYHKRREEKGIKVKLLSQGQIRQRVLKELGGYRGIEMRFTKEVTPTSMLIYDSKFFIFTWGKNPTAILINSMALAEQYRKHFLDVWRRAAY